MRPTESDEINHRPSVGLNLDFQLRALSIKLSGLPLTYLDISLEARKRKRNISFIWIKGENKQVKTSLFSQWSGNEEWNRLAKLSHFDQQVPFLCVFLLCL